METSRVTSFLFIIDCISSFWLLRLCFFWKELKILEKKFSKLKLKTLKQLRLQCNKTEIKLSIENSESKSSEETLHYIQAINCVTSSFSSGIDKTLRSSPDSTENNNLPSAPPDSKINSQYLDTGSNVQTSINSEKFSSSSEKLITPTLTGQGPLLSPIPVARSINPGITPRPIQSRLYLISILLLFQYRLHILLKL